METMTGPIDCNPTIPCPFGMYGKSFRLEGFFIQVTSKVDQFTCNRFGTREKDEDPPDLKKHNNNKSQNTF